MPLLHQLPGELIALICDELSACHHPLLNYKQPAAPSLAALCLVSSRCRAIAQPALYRHVGELSGDSLLCFLQTVTRARRDLGRYTRSFTQTSWAVPRYRRRFIRMALRLNIAGVNKTHVRWGFDDDAHLANTLAAIVFVALPNLRHISWSRPRFDDRILALEDLQPKLSSLKLVGTVNFDDIRKLCQIPTLRTLSVDHVYLYGLSIPKESITAYHLELNHCYFREDESVVILSAFRSLETLHIRGGFFKSRLLASALQSQKDTLRELVWHRFCDPVFTSPKQQISSLSFLGALRYLDIQHGSIGNASRCKATILDKTHQKDKALLTDFLPGGLESLVIRGVDRSLLRAVARLVRKCPAIYGRLHDVRLHFSEPDWMPKYEKLRPAFEERRICYEVVEEKRMCR